MKSRWWTYQRERFPLATHIPFSILLSAAALGWSTAHADRPPPTIIVLAAASLTTLLFFLQLRVADEFKDFDDDRRFRPERPVPRGLVTLRELGWIAVAAGLIQLVVAALVAPTLLATLGMLWAYWGLMSAEFFVRDWLKAHPVVYLGSHMFVVAFLLLHITAFDWLTAANMPDPRLGAFLALAFFVGVVVEIGRKTWAPEQEREGVETYTRLWGVRRTALAFAIALVVAAGFALWALFLARFQWTGAAIIGVAAIGGATAAILFAAHPRPGRAKLVELASALTAFALYVVVGILPRYGGNLP